jgi:AraC-like DNA-binding protein
VRGAAGSARTVSVHAVSHLINLGVAAAIPRDILTDAAGITDQDLRDADARVPLAAEIALWQMLAKHISNPAFGVRAGAAYRLRAMGLLGYVVGFSGALSGALRRVQRYGRVFTEAVEFQLLEGRPELALAKGHPALGPGLALAESFRLAAVLQLSREATGADIVPSEVVFTYPQPSSTIAHREYFRCPIRFGAPTASIVFGASDLNLPLVRADETLAGYLGNYTEQVLASLVQGETTRHMVHAAIWSLLGDGTPSLEHVAAVLRVPPRTLQRRLAAEGTSLRAETEEIRKTMALALLRDRSNSIEEVAFLLGFAEPSTFFRSFKQWTGTTPRRFRIAAE